MRVPRLLRGYGSGQTLSDLQGNGCKSGAHLRCPLIVARVFPVCIVFSVNNIYCVLYLIVKKEEWKGIRHSMEANKFRRGEKRDFFA